MAQQNMYGTPFLDVLEYQPEAAYYGMLNRQPRMGGQQEKYFQNQFQNYYNKYLGNLANQITAGGAPTQRFTDYLSDQNPADEYRSMAPTVRNDYGRTASFSPSTRFLYR